MSLFSINTNVGALAALQSLDATQEALTTAQNEVSTGQKVSSAQDNPAIYSIANTINANIAGLSAVSDSLNFGAQVVGTASTAISSINTVLTALQQTVTQAGTTGINLTTLQASVTADLAEVDQYATQATFNGVNLLDPTVASGNVGSANVVQGLDGSTYNIPNQGLKLDATATTLTQALGISGLDVTAPGYAVTFSDSLSLGSFSSTATGSTLPTGSNADFQIVTGTGATAQTYSFEFTDNSASNLAPALLTPQTANTHIIDVQINTSTQSTNQIVGSLVSAIRGAGFSVQQNTDGSLNITGSDPTTDDAIASVAYGTVGTGGVASAFAADATQGVTTAALSNTSLSAALVATVQSAITSANSVAASLGAASDQITGLENFTTSLSSALTSGVGALTDADLASESAVLTSLQTKQQLATQSLSIANKQPQSLLTLFQGL
jgi:flagellin